MGMIRRLVPLAVFNTVVPVINEELGSIPKRSRKNLGSGFPARQPVQRCSGDSMLPTKEREFRDSQLFT
jgi:hypothetical protein